MSATRSAPWLMSAAAIVVVVAGLRAASGIVGPVMLALLLTIVFHPLRVGLERRMPTWVASVAVLTAAYVLILGLTVALLVSIGRTATLVGDYTAEMDDITQDVGDWFAAIGVGQEQVDAMVRALDIGGLVDVLTGALSGVLSIVSGLFFLVTLLLFLAFDSAQAERLSVGARQHRPRLVDALGSFARGARSYLGVSALFGLIVAVIDTGALWVLGVPGAFVWGVLAFVTNFIPNIGFVIGVIPPALIGLLEGGPGLMIAVIVVYSVVNLVIQSVIQPRYIGNAVGLSTTLTFLSLVFWTFVLGPLGAILAVPMSLLVKAVLVDAEPEATWLGPLVSGHPEDPGTVTRSG